MKRVGFVGWRGMVGSVLMQRMREEKDFALIEPVFFTTSNVGASTPDITGTGQGAGIPLGDGRSIENLKAMDIIITCQGVNTPVRFFPNCAHQVGMGTGLMPPQRYE